MPNRVKDDELAGRIEELQCRAEEAGRSQIPVTVVGPMRDPAGVERLEQAGVHRLVSWLPAQGRDAVEQVLDSYRAGMQEYQRAGG
jgi:hypothetical protein